MAMPPAEPKDGITIEAGVLARAMRDAAQVTEARNTIPVLANVRLIADGDKLEITTSDLDIEYRQVVPLPALGTLATTVDAKRLKDIAAAVDNGAQIGLALDNQRLTVKAGRSRFVLPALGADLFPTMKGDDMAAPVEMPGKALAEAIKRVAWSVDTNVTRYWLCGVFLDAEDGKLRLTALDGKTMAITTLAEPFPAGAASVILPTKLARLIEHMAEDHSAAVSIAWGERLVRAEIGTAVITGKLIEGQFPAYRRMIPDAQTDTALVALFDPAVMRGAIRRSRLVQIEKDRRIRLLRGAGAITVAAQSPEAGESTEEVLADCTESWASQFDTDQLDRMLEAIGGETIEMHQADCGSPVLLRRAVDDGAIGVVMPTGK